MFCGRRVSVLVSTLALVAGCGATDRVEVTGTVTDLRTGRALAFARVTGANGVATHTNEEGHFTIAVVRGVRTQLRVSADGHLDAVQSLAMDAPQTESPTFQPLAFQLQPTEENDLDPSADAVVRWATAPWVRRRFGHAESVDAARLDGGNTNLHICPYPTGHTTEDAVDVDAVYPWLGDGAVCVSCHQQSQAGLPQADVIAGSLADISVTAPHAYLADACLACHQEAPQSEASQFDGLHADSLVSEGNHPELYQESSPSSRGPHRREAAGSCARCHGETEVDLIFEDENTGLPATYEQVVATARAAMGARLETRERARIAALIAWLEADGSRGVHNPALVRELAAQAAAH